MTNMVLAWPNRAAAATVTGPDGGWSAGSPPSYLHTRQIAQVARAMSADTRNTRLYISTAAAIECGLLALVGHNLTTAGQFRLRGFSADPVPAVDLDFSGGRLPSALTYTRAGVATYIGADGLLKTAAANEPRFEYEAGVCLGLRSESAATNNMLWCRDGTNAAWSKTGATATLTATGVDGVANSATRLTATLANGRISQAAGSGTSTFSVWLRRVSGTGTINLSFNNLTTVTAVAVTSTWTKFSVTGTVTTCVIQIATSGDVIEFDYAQVESGSVATSSILTTTTSAARNTDVCTLANIAAQGPSFTAGSLHVRGRLTAAANHLLASLYDSASNYVGINVNSSSVVSAVVRSAGSTVASITGNTVTPGTAYVNAAMAWQVNDVRAAFNAASGTADTVAAMPTGTTYILAIGRESSGAGVGYQHIERVRVWSTCLTDAQLQSLSTDSEDCEIPSAYDSGAQDAWPAAWVSGTTAEEKEGMVGCAIFAPASPQTYAYWRLDLIDEANTSPPELGRIFMGSRWQPTINALWGAGIGYEARGLVSEMDSGSEYVVDRPAPRVCNIAFPGLSDAEAVGHLLEMQRRGSNTGEVLFQWDPDDTLYLPARTFLARIRRASPLTAVFIERNECELEVKELL